MIIIIQYIHMFIIVFFKDKSEHFRYPDALPIRTILTGNHTVRINEDPLYMYSDSSGNK